MPTESNTTTTSPSTQLTSAELTVEEANLKGGARVRWFGLVILPFALGVLIFWLHILRSDETGTHDLPIIGPAPDFALVDSEGRAVSREDLLGKVWVADFVFTRCAGPCPELTLRMRSLQTALEQHADDVKLVSFSLDPEYDTPPVLQKYAHKNRADLHQWRFLTGTKQKTMHEMIRNGFLQSVMPAKDGEPITHSTYFVLVDQAGQIRGFYQGLEPTTKKHLVSDVEQLLAEHGGA